MFLVITLPVAPVSRIALTLFILGSPITIRVSGKGNDIPTSKGMTFARPRKVIVNALPERGILLFVTS